VLLTFCSDLCQETFCFCKILFSFNYQTIRQPGFQIYYLFPLQKPYIASQKQSWHLITTFGDY